MYALLSLIQAMLNMSTLFKKNFHLLLSAVISEYFSKNRMIISVVAAKILYLKNVRFLLGHPVHVGIIGVCRQLGGSVSD